MSMTLTFLTDLYRVQIAATGLTATDVRVERSINQQWWHTVRGGVHIVPNSGAFTLDDYEYDDGVTNYYRIVDITDDSVDESDDIVPNNGGVVILKSIKYPFLNRAIKLPPYDEITRDFRGSVNDISGRSIPVAMTDLRTSPASEIQVITDTVEEARDLDLILAANTVFLLQTPFETVSGCERVSNILGGHIVFDQTTSQRRPYQGSKKFIWSLPYRRVAPPGPDFTGTTMTWQAVVDRYGSWTDVVNANATWIDLLQNVAGPSDTVVL